MALESVYPCIFLRFTVYLILTLLTPHPDKALLTGKPKETISLLIQPGSSESQSIRTKDISSLLSLIWNYYKNGVTEGYTVSWSCIDLQMFWAGGEADGQATSFISSTYLVLLLHGPQSVSIHGIYITRT